MSGKIGERRDKRWRETTDDIEHSTSEASELTNDFSRFDVDDADDEVVTYYSE